MRTLLLAALGPVALLATSPLEARSQALDPLEPNGSPAEQAPAGDRAETSLGAQARVHLRQGPRIEIRPGAEGQPDWILEAPIVQRSTWLLAAPIGRLHEVQAGELEAFGWALRLDRGTEEAPRESLDLELGAVGALYDFEVGPRSTVFRLQAPADAFVEAVEIFTSRLTSLELGPEDKKDALTALATSGALGEDPVRDLEEALTRQLLGPDHPLCRELNLFALFASMDLAEVRDRWLAAQAAGQHAVSAREVDDTLLTSAHTGWTRLLGDVEPWQVPVETLLLARPASHPRPTLHVPLHGFGDPFWALVEAREVKAPQRLTVGGYEGSFHLAWSRTVLARPAWSAAVPGYWITEHRDQFNHLKDMDSQGLPAAFDVLASNAPEGTPGLGGDPLTEHVLAQVVPHPTFTEVARAQAFAMVAEGMAPPPIIGDGKIGGAEIEGAEQGDIEPDPQLLAQAKVAGYREEWPAPPKCEWLVRTDRSAFAQSTPDGQRIAQRMLDRLGGAQRWSELEGLVFEAENTLAPGQAPMRTTKTSELDSGDMRLDIHLRGAVQTMIYEDGRAYVEQQGRQLVLPDDRARRMGLAEQTSLANLLHHLSLQTDLGVRFEEPNLIVFDLQGELARLGLDEEGWVRSISTDDGNAERYLEFTDYTEVDGLWFANAYVLKGAGGSEASTQVADIQPRFAAGSESE